MSFDWEVSVCEITRPRAWKLLIRETKDLTEGVDEDYPEESLPEVRERLAKILEARPLPRHLFEEDERDRWSQFPDEFRDCEDLDDFNSTLADLYDFADDVRIWIEPWQ